ncbi:MAG: peptidoglycan DD-metalloendopeptidase family protein [Hyphomonas sp.]|nr:peptidoglycan DD-metalloendopeptidase family protein [Hyphomonas sp.]
MKPTRLLLLASAAMMLAACDFVRFPGDGGPPPQTPDAGPAVPPGAPGPPPPGAPVDDPYGMGGDDAPVDTPADADDAPDDPDTDGVVEPVDPGMPDTDPVDTGETSDDVPDSSAPDAEPDTLPADGPDGDAPDTDTAPDPDTGTDTPADPGSDTVTDPDTDVPTEPETPPDADAETPDDPDTSPDAPVEDGEDTASLPQPAEPAFSYFEPGALLPGSGQGAPEQIAYAPDIVFPIEGAPAYLQSQVFSFGGGVAGGDQCDARNYDYPWRDNFCEVRSANRTSPYCPTPKVHQGQDIRVGTPEDCNTLRRTPASDRTLHKVVAVEDGIISHVGTYSVNLRAGGRIYKYMHMNMDKLQVKAGDPVQAGQHIGYVSNDFGGTPTTFHLHFEITQNDGNAGWVHVPPYLSLAQAYERREGGPGEMVRAGNVGVASTPFVIPEGMEIIE